MMRSLLVAGVFAGAIACGGTRNAPAPTGEAAGRDDARFGGSTPADSLFFSFERTPCFGRCPTYAVHVYRSGHATYLGRQHVERIGAFSGRLSTEAMEQLLAEAEAIGFWKRPASYDSEVTDLPSTYVRVVSGDRDHKVRARYNVPNDFKGFIDRCERLLQNVDWQAAEGGQ